MGKSGKGIPERWEDYSNMGKKIPGTRFIALKVPLKDALLNNLDVSVEFHDVNSIVEQCPDIGLIIDLTNTDRYYDSSEFRNHNVSYYKLKTFGHIVPIDNIVFKFFEVVQNYLANNKNNNKLIGVHCTHGVNRTGYMIVRFMIQILKMTPDKAIDTFNKARGHNIERENYLEDLKRASWNKPPKFVPNLKFGGGPSNRDPLYSNHFGDMPPHGRLMGINRGFPRPFPPHRIWERDFEVPFEPEMNMMPHPLLERDMPPPHLFELPSRRPFPEHDERYSRGPFPELESRRPFPEFNSRRPIPEYDRRLFPEDDRRLYPEDDRRLFPEDDRAIPPIIPVRRIPNLEPDILSHSISSRIGPERRQGKESLHDIPVEPPRLGNVYYEHLYDKATSQYGHSERKSLSQLLHDKEPTRPLGRPRSNLPLPPLLDNLDYSQMRRESLKPEPLMRSTPLYDRNLDRGQLLLRNRDREDLIRPFDGPHQNAYHSGARNLPDQRNRRYMPY